MDTNVKNHCKGRTILVVGVNYHEGSTWFLFTDSTALRLKHHSRGCDGTVFDVCGVEMYCADGKSPEILSRLPVNTLLPNPAPADVIELVYE